MLLHLVLLQLTEEMEKAQKQIDDLNSQLMESKMRWAIFSLFLAALQAVMCFLLL